jgi:small-conductance mechanosensitive channel
MNAYVLNDLVKHSSFLTRDHQVKILWSLLILGGLIFLQFLIVRLIYRRVTSPGARFLVRRIAGYVTGGLAILIIGRLWFEGIGSLSTFLGIITAGLAIALRDLFSNFAGWLYILGRRPFTVGNRIQIGEHKGDVIDIRLFQFTLLEIGNWIQADQSTGRVIHVPNNRVFTASLANYDQGLKQIWCEIPVLLTFESDWKKAKAVLLEIGKAYQSSQKKAVENLDSKEYHIQLSSLTPEVYTRVREGGILLCLRYLCEPRNRRDVESRLWEEVLTRFDELGEVNLTYPTVRQVGIHAQPLSDVDPFSGPTTTTIS